MDGRGARVWVLEYVSAGGALDQPSQQAALMPQGCAMRDALVTDLLRAPGWQVAVASGPQAPNPPSGAEIVVTSGAGLMATLVQRASTFDAVWVVAPESAGLLAAAHAAVTQGGGYWLGCSAETIRVAGSKRATLAALSAQAVATPRDHAAHAAAWVVKPDDGAGSLDTRVHADHAAAAADLRRRQAAGRAATLEPFVDGEALSLSLCCGPDGAELLAVNRQRLQRLPDGHLRYDGVMPSIWSCGDPRWPQAEALARQVHAALPGLWGWVGIDVVWHPRHGPVVIEVNPRATCGFVGLSARLQRNLGAEWLAKAMAMQRIEDAVHA